MQPHASPCANAEEHRHTLTFSLTGAPPHPELADRAYCPTRALQVQQAVEPVPVHCIPHCPVATTTIVPTAELCKNKTALSLSVTGPLEVLHMSDVASVSAHALTYQSAVQECIRRLPSFAPSSISLFDFALRRLVHHFSYAGRVRVGSFEMTPDAHPVLQQSPGQLRVDACHKHALSVVSQGSTTHASFARSITAAVQP